MAVIGNKRPLESTSEPVAKKVKTTSLNDATWIEIQQCGLKPAMIDVLIKARTDAPFTSYTDCKKRVKGLGKKKVDALQERFSLGAVSKNVVKQDDTVFFVEGGMTYIQPKPTKEEREAMKAQQAAEKEVMKAEKEAQKLAAAQAKQAAKLAAAEAKEAARSEAKKLKEAEKAKAADAKAAAKLLAAQAKEAAKAEKAAAKAALMAKKQAEKAAAAAAKEQLKKEKEAAKLKAKAEKEAARQAKAAQREAARVLKERQRVAKLAAADPALAALLSKRSAQSAVLQQMGLCPPSSRYARYPTWNQWANAGQISA